MTQLFHRTSDRKPVVLHVSIGKHHLSSEKSHSPKLPIDETQGWINIKINFPNKEESHRSYTIIIVDPDAPSETNQYMHIGSII